MVAPDYFTHFVHIFRTLAEVKGQRLQVLTQISELLLQYQNFSNARLCYIYGTGFGNDDLSTWLQQSGVSGRCWSMIDGPTRQQSVLFGRDLGLIDGSATLEKRATESFDSADQVCCVIYSGW